MSPDMAAIEAYRQKEADYAAKVKQLEEATANRDEACMLRLTNYTFTAYKSIMVLSLCLLQAFITAQALAQGIAVRMAS